MKDEKLIRYSKYCPQRSFTRQNQSPYSHEDRNQVDHHYIRQSIFQRKTKKYQAQMQFLVSPYKIFESSIMQTLKNLKNKIENLTNNLSDQIHQAIQNQYFPRSSKVKKKLYKCLINNSYSDLNCMQISEIMSVMEEIFNKSSESQKSQMYEKCQRIGHRIEKNLTSIITASNQDIQDVCNINFLSFTQSTIKRREDSTFPSQISILRDLDISQSQIHVKPYSNKHQYHKIAKSQEPIDIFDEGNFSQNYYLQLQKQSKLKQKAINNPHVQKLPQSKKSQIQTEGNLILNKNGSFQQSIMDSDDNIDLEEQEDQDKLNQTIKESQISIAKHLISLDKQKFQKIQQIQPSIDIEGFKFDIKVRVCKILYHSILNTGNIVIPKIKFIAGDQTGVSIIFTNYVPGIKINTQLEMHDCSFLDFKGSPEIINNRNFRIMNLSQPKITINYKGVKISSFIKQITNGIDYSMPDSKCSLIRYIARQLKKNKTFKIYKMIVKIMFIINEWTSGVFCQVGDSSGVMMAYLKKKDTMNYKQGDVLRLMKVKAQRGKQRNNLIQEQIIFIDAYLQQSKIYPFRLQFPEINDEIMS